MRAHLPVSIAIFDWSGNVFRLARLGIVSLCAVCVCRCSLAKLERFTAAGPLQFSSIRSDHRAWSRARFLSGIVEPISTDRPRHVLPPFLYLRFSRIFFFFFFPPFYPDPDSFRSLLILPNSSTVDRLVIACLHSESWRFSSFLTASTRVNFTFYSSPRIWPFYSKDE